MKEFRKRYWYEVALCASFFQLIYSPIAHTATMEGTLVAAAAKSNVNPEKDTYTVNFNNVSIIELIRFASKITNLNFVFEEANLQFSVTVVSEEPISAKSLMAALSQVLRMHNLILLEQDGNVLITTNAGVKQIPPIVSADLPESQRAGNAAIVTRVFRIKNANLNTLASIIRPMSSQGAMIDVSLETRQLIVTDITTNVEQIAQLLASLDAPHTSLDIESYVVKNNPTKDIISLTQQILSPFTEGNPLIFVPQTDTNSIFIVSTPYLIERALTVMEDLDIPPKTEVVGKQGPSGKNILLYKALNRSLDELASGLKTVAGQIKSSSGGPTPLTDAIDNMQTIEDTNSLMFVTDPDTITKIKEILASLDTPASGKTSFYIYRIQHAEESLIENSLKQMKERLESAPRPDTDLINAIESMKWIKETNSLVFTGSEGALNKLREIVPTFDIISPARTEAQLQAQLQAKSNFYIYKIQHAEAKQIEGSLKQMKEVLEDAPFPDKDLIQAIDSMKWIKETNSLVFTGSEGALNKLREIVPTFDISPSTARTEAQLQAQIQAQAQAKSNFYIYKIQHAEANQIEDSLKQITETLEDAPFPDKDLIQAINSMKWIKETNSLMFTGSQEALNKLREIVPIFDISPSTVRTEAKAREKAREQAEAQLQAQIQSQAQAKSNFYIYKIQHADANQIEGSLEQITETLKDAPIPDKDLIQAIESMKWIKETNSLVFTGTEGALNKLREIVPTFDISPSIVRTEARAREQAQEQALAQLQAQKQAQAQAQAQVKSNFYIYKIQHANANQIEGSLKQITETLEDAPFPDKDLIQAIDSMKWIKESNSLVFTGSEGALNKLREIVPTFDVSPSTLRTEAQIQAKAKAQAKSSFFIYHPQYRTGEELGKELSDLASSLKSSELEDPLLLETLDSMKWVPSTKSMTFTGDPQSIAKIQDMLKTLDTPTPAMGKTSFYIYKIQRAPENQIEDSLKQMKDRLQSAPRPDTDLIAAIESMKWIKETNSLIFTGSEGALKKLEEVVPTFDISAATPSGGKSNFFVYHPLYRSGDELSDELSDLKSNLKDSDLADASFLDTLDSMKWVSGTKSLIFTGDSQSLERIQGILKTMDTPTAGKTSFYIYKIQRGEADQIEDSLKQMEERLEAAQHPDKELIDAIKSMKWMKESNSLIFTGSEGALKKLEEVVPTFDITPPAGSKAPQPLAKSSFFVYHPQYRSGHELSDELSDLKSTLKESNLADPAFLETLDSRKWVSSTNSLIFTGDPQSIERIQGILKTMDAPTAHLTKTSQVFIYKPVHLTPDQIQNALKSLVSALESTHTQADQNLVTAINALKWNAESRSFMVNSDPGTIERLKALLASIDTALPITAEPAKGFYLYKLQNAQCETVLKELKNIAKKISSSTLQSQNMVAAIEKIECIKSNNSLLITGTNEAIEQIRTLIAEFDTKSMAPLPTGAQSFLIYKPKYLPAQEIRDALSDLASDLQDSGLNDPELFQALSTMKFVEQTGSLLFTGSPEGLDKVQALINTIDTSTALGAIQSIGNVTFLLYKVQSASPDKLITSLKTFADDLKKSNIEDKRLAEAINTVKWIKETNSLMFTGSTQTLEKVEQLVKKFDLPSLGIPPAPPPPAPVERKVTTFVIYNPKYLTGNELISILCDFMQNLMTSGVSDPGLFDAINNLRWIDKTSSLLISGDRESIDKVQQLLVRFDVPSKEIAPPSIEEIDNTSFLVYKLQYHPGNDIQDGLRQVAATLKGTSTSQSLLETIGSIQWIQVTNSLLCTGQQDVLVKLKDLIQNLDTPLRQVFIEVLVIQTGLENTQDFGLAWGGQIKYMDKTILQTGNFPIFPSAASPNGQAFQQNLQAINATNTPNNTSIPFASGFDLGVIGDIIMHKGKSFISLGSLLNAIQVDRDSTILLNPKIITQDNRQSTIFVGQNVPYTGSIVNNTSNNTVSTANIEYRDVGVSLTITPFLGENDVVTMDIVQDISQVVSGPTTTSTQQLTGITTTHTHMETRVHVPSNLFVALSGMINESKTHFRTAIPCLGGLPVIGLIFSENDRTVRKDNVIIFIRPQIVNTYAEYKEITQRQEWLYKDEARIPILKEQFDEGIDMVKLPENE